VLGALPAALVISHRHVAGNGDVVRSLAKEFKIPVMMHPSDARHPKAMVAQVPYEDPMAHTAGHIALYSTEKAKSGMEG